MSRKQVITATGIVIPVEWDENGNPRAFALSTYDEAEYLIDGRNRAGRELMQMPQEKIQVTGELGPLVNDRRLITITRYRAGG